MFSFVYGNFWSVGGEAVSRENAVVYFVYGGGGFHLLTFAKPKSRYSFYFLEIFF